MSDVLSPPRQPKGRVRIVDVAREAGVSAQTVSNVLNNKPGFGEETKVRVLAAVERTGYIPDQAGRQLRTGQSQRIAFSMATEDLNPRNPFALTFLQAVMATASRFNRRVVVYTHDNGAEAAFRADAVGRETDGFVLANAAPGDPRVAILEELHIPYAVMGRTLPHQSQSWVDIDNASAISLAAEHLIQTGRRRIAYADYDSDAHWSSDRMRGVLDTLDRHGLTLRDDWTLRGPIDVLEGRISQLLASEDRPDALITASDSIGILAVNIAHAHQVDVGGDLAITGFDGGVLATTVLPNLTTVEIPVAAIAERVMQTLIARIDGAEAPEAGMIVPTRLAVAGTSVKAPVDSRTD